MANYANLDNVSTTSRNLCRGCYSLRRENALYGGPTVRVRRATNNVEQDFFADGYGRLWSGSNSTGQQITTWSSNSQMLVVNLYDQSSLGNHATQTTQASQPILANYTMSNALVPTYYLDTRTGRFLNLPAATIPTGAMTVIARHGAIDNTQGAIISGGNLTTNQCYTLRRNSNAYQSSFFANDTNFSRYADGSVIADVIDSAGNNRMFVNGDLDLTLTKTGKNIGTVNHRIGGSPIGALLNMNGDLLFVLIFAGVITDSEIDTLSLRFKRGSVVRLPSIEKYIGSASNLGNTELLLCSRSNTSGKYVFQSDIAPNFSMYFDAKVPSWSNNTFRVGIHSSLQSFYYGFSSSNQMNMLDMNLAVLKTWTLNSNNLLSNNAWNSIKVVNSDSNLIVTVNGRGYSGLVPNHPTALRNWRNGCFSFEASNAPTVTGSNSIRRFYSQSITRFSDPIVVKDSLVSTVVNTAKLGSTQVTARTVDTNVLFGDWVFGSNIYSTSNCTLSNLRSSNAFTSNETVQNSILIGNGVSQLDTVICAHNSSMTTGGERVIALGKNTSMYNQGVLTYSHFADASTLNRFHMGHTGSERTLTVTSGGFVGIGTTTPSMEFDVNGQALFRSNCTVNGILTNSNLRASNAIIPTVTTSNVNSSNVTCTNLNGVTSSFTGTTTMTGTLNVNNSNMSLRGGAGATPTVLALNSTGALNTTGIIQFVNSGHRITNTDSNPWDGMTRVGTGHNLYYISGGHNFNGQVNATTGIRIGADSASLLRDFRMLSFTVPANPTQFADIVISHNLNWTSYNLHVSFEDLVTPIQNDTFAWKVVAKNSNDIRLVITRSDASSGWTRSLNAWVFYYRT